jgi:hypothetical protein
MLLRGCLETQLNNCSVSDRSLGFLPLSHPDIFPIDLYSFYTFPFLDPLLGWNPWILTSRFFNLILNHFKHNKFHSFIPRFFFLSLGRYVRETIIRRKIVAALPFRSCLIWLHRVPRQKLLPLSIGCCHFSLGKSREGSILLHDVPQDIRSRDSI